MNELAIDHEKLEVLVAEYRSVNARRNSVQKELQAICKQATAIEQQISVVLGFAGYRLPLEDHVFPSR